MELKVKVLKWSAGLPVAMLNKKTAGRIGAHLQDRISIKTLSKNPKEIFTIIDTITGLVGETEIAVSSELKARLGLRIGQKVDIGLASLPQSIFFIREKLKNKELSEKEINEIIQDIVNNSLSEAEIALFVSAMYKQGMSFKETIALIKAILKSGNKFSLNKKFVADKHSIGGIAGNRTTPIVVSICAAGGLIMPKTSSRAITSAAGTADVLETLAQVEFSLDEVKKIIKKTNACMVWGGALGMVPADSAIIKVEKILGIDPEAQLLASIMSKKLAVGSKYIVIDIPHGKGAKVTKTKALVLKKKFEKLGRYFNKKLICVLTDGTEPIGNGIGPALELVDVIRVLDTNLQAPNDLERKSLFLAGKIFELTGKAKKGKGFKFAREILYSGKAFLKFKQIIEAQKGKLSLMADLIKRSKKDNSSNHWPVKFKKNILSDKSGKIIEINNKKINALARITGCPADKFAGLYLFHHVGDKIKTNEKLLTIYSESKSRLKEAADFCKNNNPIKVK